MTKVPKTRRSSINEIYPKVKKDAAIKSPNTEKIV
jgi:hypothetical protein